MKSIYIGIGLLICSSAVTYSMYINGKLLKAVKDNNIPKVVAALDQGAQVNRRTNKFCSGTPLHVASYYTDAPELIQVLLDRGANVMSKNQQTGLTPLHCAAVNGQIEAAKIFVQYGADCNILNEKGETPFDVCSILRNKQNKQALSQLLLPQLKTLIIQKIRNNPDYFKGKLGNLPSELRELIGF
jgi:ankyrin repeat protein